jgi:hypothetical protein
MPRSVRSEDIRWDRADRLPSHVIEVLRGPPGEVTAIVATVDDDGAPRTATFGAMRPVGSDGQRFACNRVHVTYRNVVRDGRVMVAVFGPPDVAVGIRGRARVLKEHMDTLPADAVVQIDIDEIKNDHLPDAPMASGVTYTVSPALAAQLDAVNAELEATGTRDVTSGERAAIASRSAIDTQ